MIVSYCTLTEGALNATQLIWVNLIMDILGALALASTRPVKSQDRYNSGSKIMTPAMYRQIFGMTVFMTIIMMVIMFAGKSVFNLTYTNATQTIDKDIFGFGKQKMIHMTLIWNTFVFMQIFNLINCRDVSVNGMNGFSGLHKNFMTYLILLIIFAVQFVSCFTGLGRIFFEAGPTGGREFLVTIVAASAVLLANCLLKLLPAYDNQAKAKAFKPVTAGPELNEVDEYE